MGGVNCNKMGNQFQKSDRLVSPNVREVYQAYRQYLKPLRLKQKAGKMHSSQQRKRRAIDGLFESFRHLNYTWAQQIYPMFYKYFYQGFDSIWMESRQSFYENLLLLCQETIDDHQTVYVLDFRKVPSKQSCFYEDGPGSKPADSSQLKIDSLRESIHILNQSILKGDADAFPQCKNLGSFIKQIELQPSKSLKSELFHADLIQTTSKRRRYKSEYNVGKIQNSSILVPQTVFLDRLTEECKAQIDQFVSFYGIFSNTLQQVINSASMISCPLKHFEASIRQKVQRKKIKKGRLSEKQLQKNSRQMIQYQMKRQYNNNILLFELRDFNEAYSDFIWRYLNLDRMSDTFIGTLITFDTVYNVVFKSVWAMTGWIGERGFEWQEARLPKVIQMEDIDPKITIPRALIEQMEELQKQSNPMRYLKKIIIIYREVSKSCLNADKLLTFFEKLFIQVIKRKKHGGIFRMQNLIEKLIKIDETNGQICYAWTTWNAIVEMLKSKVNETSQKEQIQREFLIVSDDNN